MRNVLVSQFSKVNQVVPRMNSRHLLSTALKRIPLSLSVLSTFVAMWLFYTSLLLQSSFEFSFLYSNFLSFLFVIFIIWYLFNLKFIIDWVGLAWPGLAYRLFSTFLLFILISHRTNILLFNSNVSRNIRLLVVF